MEDIVFFFSYFGITLGSLFSPETLMGIGGSLYYIMVANDRKTTIF